MDQQVSHLRCHHRHAQSPPVHSVKFGNGTTDERVPTLESCPPSVRRFMMPELTSPNSGNTAVRT